MKIKRKSTKNTVATVLTITSVESPFGCWSGGRVSGRRERGVVRRDESPPSPLPSPSVPSSALTHLKQKI